jgi:tetratricopeptide (TPR) repeat protein
MKVPFLKLVVSADLAAGLLLVFSTSVHAQVRSIRGKVTDENDKPIQGATVRIEGTDMYRVFPPGRTGKDGGYFQLLGNQAGTYRVIVRKDGFEPAFKENLRPEMGEEVTADFQLKPGSDYKFSFEMTDAERRELQKQNEQQQKRQEGRKKFSAEVKARFDKGVEFFDAGQYEDALTEFNAALVADPNQPGILARAGDCYMRLKRNDEALDAYDKALAIDPNDGSIYAQKGVVLSRLGRTAESQEMFRKSAELDPKGAALNFYNLGATLYNAGDMEKAAEAFRQSIAADTGYAESYYLLGMCLSGDETMFSSAVDAFKKYVEIGKKPDQVQIAKDMISALGGN